jgi:hypothetical protein
LLNGTDMILDGGIMPTFEDITDYINMPARKLWLEMNSFIQEKYAASPKLTYSKCSAKPGWNVKYQKSGKSLCTLYPEKDGFEVLLVIKLDMFPIVEAMGDELSPEVLHIAKAASPFNGTKWLMIPVLDDKILSDVKQLMVLKYGTKGAAAVRG